MRRVHMKRWEIIGSVRFLTFSCNHRLPLLDNPGVRDLFVDHLRAAHSEGLFRLHAWVVMPEHVHLLLTPSLPSVTTGRVLSRIKRPMAKAVVARWRNSRAAILDEITGDRGVAEFWLRGGGYDRNVRDVEEYREKLAYVHENPVRRGLVDDRLDWAWSSARWYGGDPSSPIPIDRIET